MRTTRTVANSSTAKAPVICALHRVRKTATSGFTLLELTAVVAIISVLVSLLCAALNQTRDRALRISCLDNMKQLNLAWQMYSDENEGALPLNQTASGPIHHRIPLLSSSSNSWVAGNPLFDTNHANIRRGKLFPYVRSVATYRCPMDDARVDDHPELLRTRSYSMNAFLGGDLAMNPAMNVADVRRPSSTFVFIEEHQSSRWGSSFMVISALKPVVGGGSSLASWVSTPADRHDQGCNLTFADGHIEYWRWYTPKTERESMLSSTSGNRHRDVRDLGRLQAVVGQ